MDSGRSKQPTTSLVENDEMRGPPVRHLWAHGCRVLVAIDEEDALENRRVGGADADLILVNLFGSTSAMSPTGCGISRHASSLE